MEPTLDDYATDLLRHLGVELVQNTHHRPDGSIVDEINIYSQRVQLNHVLGWAARQHETLTVRVFEGSRPPF